MAGFGGPSSQEELISTLKRAIFMRESQQAATLYQQLINQDKSFALETKRQHELSRLLELGNEPNLALCAYQTLLAHCKPEDELYRPSLRAAGHLSYRVKEFHHCRHYLEEFLGCETIPPNEKADAENLLNKLPDGKGVRDQATIKQAKNKPQPKLDGSSFTSESNPFAKLNDPNDDLAAPSEDYGDSSIVQGINLQIEDVPEPPKPKTKRPNLKLANLTNFDAIQSGDNLPPPPPKKNPYGEFTPQNEQLFNNQPQLRVSQDEMQGMMFGQDTPKPNRSSEDQLEQFSKTPPLNMHSRDVQARSNPEYNVSTTKHSNHQDYNNLPTTDDLDSIEGLNYQPPSFSPQKPQKTPAGQTPSLFDVTPSPKATRQTEKFHERKTSQPVEVDDDEESDLAAPDSDLFGNPARSARTDETQMTPPHGVANEELLESYQNQQFALILPLGSKISVSQVSLFISHTEKLSNDEARKAVVDRKGVLRSGLTLAEAVELYQQTLRFKQTFSFVVLRRELEASEMLNALKADVLTPGIRLHTEQGVKKLRWEKIRFISCGRLNRLPTVDVFVEQELRHFRMQEGGMKFLELYPRSDEDSNEACKEFLRYLTKAAPEAEVSHTVRNVLNGKTYRPQKFSSNEEYDLYNHSLLLGHFGEIVPMKELALAFSAVSSAW